MALPLTYNLRNLFVRKFNTGLTLAVIAFVVLVLAVLMAYASGIRASLRASGWPQNILILKPGATAESTSIIRQQEWVRIVQTPQIARNAAGELLLSNELCVQTNLRRVGNGRRANVAVRGVDPIAFEVHPEIRIIEGRAMQPGELECLVGKSAHKHFADLSVGGTVIMGRNASRSYRIVGVFESNGSALESEILALRSNVTNSYNRPFISSVVIRLENADAVDQAIAYVRSPAVALEARTEARYYADLSERMLEIVKLTGVLVTIMAIGAAFAVANTMYAAVDSRRREIAMLRTLGFPRRSILISFIIESLLLGLIGCMIGLSCSLFFDGLRQDFLSDTTWTVLAFEMRVSGDVILASFAVAMVVATVGALAPALRASRVRVIEALRKA